VKPYRYFPGHKQSKLFLMEKKVWIPETAMTDFMVCSSFWVVHLLNAPHIARPDDYAGYEGNSYGLLQAQGQMIMQEIPKPHMCPQGNVLIPLKTPYSNGEWPACMLPYNSPPNFTYTRSPPT